MMLLHMLEAEASAYSTQRLEITVYWVEPAVSAYRDFHEAAAVEGAAGGVEENQRRGGPIIHPWIYFRVPRQLRVYILWSSGKSSMDYVIFGMIHTFQEFMFLKHVRNMSLTRRIIRMP
jgi:hypothetical protein